MPGGKISQRRLSQSSAAPRNPHADVFFQRPAAAASLTKLIDKGRQLFWSKVLISSPREFADDTSVYVVEVQTNRNPALWAKLRRHKENS